MKVGSTVECIRVQRFNGVDLVAPGFIDEVIEVGDISSINPFLDGAYIKISSYPDKYMALDGFREIQFPPSLETEIQELLTAPIVEPIETV